MRLPPRQRRKYQRAAPALGRPRQRLLHQPHAPLVIEFLCQARVAKPWVQHVDHDGVGGGGEVRGHHFAHGEDLEQLGDLVAVVHVCGAGVVEAGEDGGLGVALRERGEGVDFAGDDDEGGGRGVGFCGALECREEEEGEEEGRDYVCCDSGFVVFGFGEGAGCDAWCVVGLAWL